MGLLFAASFGLTLWMVGANRVPAEPYLDPGAATFRAPEVEAQVADGGVAAFPVAPTTSERDPAPQPLPSLQDLAADQDPETRNEARILLGLLGAEPAAD